MPTLFNHKHGGPDIDTTSLHYGGCLPFRSCTADHEAKQIRTHIYYYVAPLPSKEEATKPHTNLLLSRFHLNREKRTLHVFIALPGQRRGQRWCSYRHIPQSFCFARKGKDMEMVVHGLDKSGLVKSERTEAGAQDDFRPTHAV